MDSISYSRIYFPTTFFDKSRYSPQKHNPAANFDVETRFKYLGQSHQVPTPGLTSPVMISEYFANNSFLFLPIKCELPINGVLAVARLINTATYR